MVDQSPYFKKLQEKVDKGLLSNEKYRRLNGIWFYKDRILLDPASELCKTIIHGHHAALGHLGYHRTLRRIKLSFWWVGMKNFIRQEIKESHLSEKYGESIAPPNLLSPLPLPEKVWESISIDFVEGLPVSQGKSVVLVVVDRYSKFVHFVTLQHPYNVAKVAQVFMYEAFRLYGFPNSIISDRDPIFLIAFWSELFKLQGTQLNISSSYHPQANGQTKRFNQCLETSAA